MPPFRLPDPPPGLQARCDAMVDQLVADLAGVQAAYAASHNGRLWQGLSSHPALPADGQEAVPDLTRKPTDQAEDWAGVGLALPSQMPCSVRVDVYQTPQGAWGYVVGGEIVVASKTYQRSVNVGPERYRDSGGGWVEFMPLVGVPEPVPVPPVPVPVVGPAIVAAAPLETETPLPPVAAVEPSPSAAELTGVGLTTAFLPKRGRRAWWLLVPAGLLVAGAAAAGLGGVEWIEQLLKSLGLT